MDEVSSTLAHSKRLLGQVELYLWTAESVNEAFV